MRRPLCSGRHDTPKKAPERNNPSTTSVEIAPSDVEIYHRFDILSDKNQRCHYQVATPKRLDLVWWGIGEIAVPVVPGIG